MSDAQSQSVPNILVVDDDLELLKLISMLLRRIGAQSHTFYDSREALRFLAKETPDLIILDLMMPDIDGMEMLRRIREHDRFAPIPIVILSAKADPDTIREGLNSGADAYVTKPYIANSLVDRVRLLLENGRKSQAKPKAVPPSATTSD